jgi:hypothetical protein
MRSSPVGASIVTFSNSAISIGTGISLLPSACGARVALDQGSEKPSWVISITSSAALKASPARHAFGFARRSAHLETFDQTQHGARNPGAPPR